MVETGRRCRSCGKEVGAAAEFCRHCGAKIDDADGQPAVQAAPPAPAAVPTKRRHLPSKFELAAAFVPVILIGLAVALKPSVLTQPAFYFVYAFLQAAVVLLAIRFLDLYEREPLLLVSLMALWGGLVATMLSLAGNGIVFGLLDENIRLAFGPAISAPLVEESAKGLALVLAFALSHWANRRYGWMEFEGVTDGIVYGAAVGLGFALVEDIFYFFQFSDESVQRGLDVFLTRVDFFGATMLGHAVYTAAFGAGLGLATWSRTRTGRYGWPLVGLAIAILLHALWNGLGSLALWIRYGWDETLERQRLHCRAGGGLLRDHRRPAGDRRHARDGADRDVRLALRVADPVRDRDRSLAPVPARGHPLRARAGGRVGGGLEGGGRAHPALLGAGEGCTGACSPTGVWRSRGSRDGSTASSWISRSPSGACGTREATRLRSTAGVSASST